MKKEEFKKIRKEMGLTQVKFAELIGRKSRMIQKYESGYYPIPLIIEKLICLIREK